MIFGKKYKYPKYEQHFVPEALIESYSRLLSESIFCTINERIITRKKRSWDDRKQIRNVQIISIVKVMGKMCDRKVRNLLKSFRFFSTSFDGCFSVKVFSGI